jgi:hypothetical protein
VQKRNSDSWKVGQNRQKSLEKRWQQPQLKEARKRTLIEKLEVIGALENDKKSYSRVAQQFGIFKSSVGAIMKRKCEWLEYTDQNRNLDYKKICMNFFSEELDQRVWHWIQAARARNIS